MTEQSKSPHPNALPNFQIAIIPSSKLERYVLNPDHISRVYGKSSGRDKARVFKSALGFDQTNWELLKQLILEELPYHEAIVGKQDEYGQRYNVTLPITGPNGKTIKVLTSWIILAGIDRPSLTTALCLQND